LGILEFLDKLVGVRRGKKAKSHKLKWKIPEVRYTAPVEDADKTIYALEKVLKARFTGGGEYLEAVHAKPFGNGVYAYLLVRTDKKTEKETIISEAYMLQEEDFLGFDVSSAPQIEDNIESLGYQYAFSRDYRVWSFKHASLPVVVFDVKDLGELVEVALPATNIDSQRERDEKLAMTLFKKLGINEKSLIPVDAVTLQLLTMQDAEKNGSH